MWLSLQKQAARNVKLSVCLQELHLAIILHCSGNVLHHTCKIIHLDLPQQSLCSSMHASKRLSATCHVCSNCRRPRCFKYCSCCQTQRMFGRSTTALMPIHSPELICAWGAALTAAPGSEALPASKKSKKLNSTKPSARPARLPSHDAAAQHGAGACPDLSTAPTHGPDQPLLLDYPGDDAGESWTPSRLVLRFSSCKQPLARLHTMLLCQSCAVPGTCSTTIRMAVGV